MSAESPTLDRALFEQERAAFCAAKPRPKKCHRRLVAERLAAHWPDVEIVHRIVSASAI